MSIRDGVAVVPVVGPIFRRANLLTQISGATSVGLLARDLREAASNRAVSAVLLDVDSPGGEANGVGDWRRCVRVSGAEADPRLHGGQGFSGGYWIPLGDPMGGEHRHP